jgi:RHS repeat-associated protein
LDYFLARYYSSAQGRFTGCDPDNYQAKQGPSFPQSWNAYSYVNNNPLSRIDPDGRGFWEKLKNWWKYDKFESNADLQKEVEEKRKWLQLHVAKIDGIENADFDKLTTRGVLLKYDRAQLGLAAAEAGFAHKNSKFVAAISIVSDIIQVSPGALRYSQTTAGGGGRAEALRKSMAEQGYVGEPIDAVQTPEGLTAIDNTRPAVAQELGIESIPVRVHSPSEPLPPDMAGRFGPAKTWGEALTYRTSTQNPPLPSTGTPTVPKLPKP